MQSGEKGARIFSRALLQYFHPRISSTRTRYHRIGRQRGIRRSAMIGQFSVQYCMRLMPKWQFVTVGLFIIRGHCLPITHAKDNILEDRSSALVLSNRLPVWTPESCRGNFSCPAPNSTFWSQLSARKRARESISPGETSARLCAVRNLTRELVVVVLGGSLAAGTFLRCDDAPATRSGQSSFGACAWPRRLEDACKAASFSANIRNLAKGGTTTFWALSEFTRVPKDADVVIVDYDVNDGAMLNDLPASFPREHNKAGFSKHRTSAENLRAQLVAATEVLLRWLLTLPKKPAVLWIDSFAFDGRRPPRSSSSAHPPPPSLADASCLRLRGRGYSVADARAALLEAYRVPRVSVRRAVWPSLECPPPSAATPPPTLPLLPQPPPPGALSRTDGLGSGPLWRCTDTCHHPTAETHSSIAGWVADALLDPPCAHGGPTAPPHPWPSEPLSPGARDLEVNLLSPCMLVTSASCLCREAPTRLLARPWLVESRCLSSSLLEKQPKCDLAQDGVFSK